ncbi:MAG TPA: hypothetical protein VGI96_36095, partial [Streptosporangiaceae bacterium]
MAKVLGLALAGDDTEEDVDVEQAETPAVRRSVAPSAARLRAVVSVRKRTASSTSWMVPSVPWPVSWLTGRQQLAGSLR